jgi:prophage regulatory protein
MSMKVHEQNTEVPRLSPDGMSRWRGVQSFIPVSKEKFRQLAAEGKAPRGIRMGSRCTLYRNSEILRFIADPVNYRVEV